MSNINIKIVFIFIAACLVFSYYPVYSQSIVDTKHNLSVSGTGVIKSESESEICIFCHTPHNSAPRGPLWNRENPGLNYTLYTSSTAQAITGQPDGSSILCLSCHDGTIALGNVLSRESEIQFSGVSVIPVGRTNISTDLSNDHAISFIYDASLANADGELRDPENISHPVSLESAKVQCTSCHDPHKDLFGKFLVTSNQYSGLCISCHEVTNWATSIHATSTAQWNGSGLDPWPYSEFNSVAENACENCHNTHNANGPKRLMKSIVEENNCMDCHNSNVASLNIESQLVKTYSHDVYNYSGIHDPEEAALVNTKHVECADCHNPHQVANLTANAPNVSGSNQGVSGINLSGSPVVAAQYEYEICFRCHADSPDKPGSSVTRKIEQSNVRLEFDPSNPSHHAVVSAGNNSNVPSLIAPLNESSVIYCSDCHASDGQGAPKGPHGSIYPQILKLRYEKGNNVIESSSTYALCYSCHDRSSILGNVSFERHDMHIRGEDVSCSICHDPHGISSSQGSSSENKHLINFDVNVVTADGSGRLRFVDLGNNHGYCQLRCHGETHTSSMDY